MRISLAQRDKGALLRFHLIPSVTVVLIEKLHLNEDINFSPAESSTKDTE
jgi:hypothetical protein